MIFEDNMVLLPSSVLSQSRQLELQGPQLKERMGVFLIAAQRLFLVALPPIL